MPKPTHSYSVHPSMQMMTDWVEQLPAKTGRSFDQWMSHIKKDGPRGGDEKALREWLVKNYKLGTNTAWWLAEKATHPEKIAEDTPDGYLKIAPTYVEEQYAAKKGSLRPIYDRLLALGLKTGKDVKACPCKTIVPLFRNHVFAQIKPATNTRVDLGLALGKMAESKISKAGGRLIDTGGKAKKDRITHRIAIESVDEIDEFVGKWLKAAYELDKERMAGSRRHPRDSSPPPQSLLIPGVYFGRCTLNGCGSESRACPSVVEGDARRRCRGAGVCPLLERDGSEPPSRVRASEVLGRRTDPSAARDDRCAGAR